MVPGSAGAPTGVPQVQQQVAAVAAVPARPSSGQIASLPKLPSFDEGGLIDRNDAVDMMHKLLGWVRGWGNSLSSVMIAMIETLMRAIPTFSHFPRCGLTPLLVMIT